MLPRPQRSGPGRRALLQNENAPLNAIDEIEVLDRVVVGGTPGTRLPRQRVLFVRCFKPVPSIFNATNVRIVGGTRIKGATIGWAASGGALRGPTLPPNVPSTERDLVLERLGEYDETDVLRTFVVRIGTDNADFYGDASVYQLALVESATSDAVPAGFDLELSAAPLYFKVDCPAEFDCIPTPRTETAPRPLVLPPLPIDYLARDAESLRTALLDRLGARLPEWSERSPADVGVTLVELLAHAGDRLAYLQDAVGTEAYLGTARQRASVRRHARLLDYQLHEGCSARAWVCFDVASGTSQTSVPAGTLLVARGDDAIEFETLHAIDAREAHNAIEIHAFGEDEFALPAGATRAALVYRSGMALSVGDVIVFEEVLGVGGWGPDPHRRHVVRITSVSDVVTDAVVEDTPGNATRYIDVTWHDEDRLPFDVCVFVREGNVVRRRVSIARGNLALAEHGRSRIATSLLPDVTEDTLYRPEIPSVAFTVPYVGAEARTESAYAATRLAARDATPAIVLEGPDALWYPVADLLASDGADTHFVVEVASDGTARLRFGDGVHGHRPVGGLRAHYRSGTGPLGNVGASILELPPSVAAGLSIVRAYNPLPARGGTAPEPIEDARELAPHMFRSEPLRAVTVADYERLAARHADVQRVVATRRWSGSRHVVFVSVDRFDGRPVDDAFRGALRSALEPYRLIGEDVEIESPVYVPLEIVMTVCLASGFRREDVRAALIDRFSAGIRSNGTKGFFHPDHFTFAQSVYASSVIEAAASIPGVDWVDMGAADARNRFQRLGAATIETRERGLIPIGRLEIARLDGDANHPENGRVEFLLRGGV